MPECVLHGDYDQYEASPIPMERGGAGRVFLCVSRNPLPFPVVYKAFGRGKIGQALIGTEQLQRLRRLRTTGRNLLVGKGLPVGETPRSSINWPIDLIAERGQPGICG